MSAEHTPHSTQQPNREQIVAAFKAWAMADGDPASEWSIDRQDARRLVEQFEARTNALQAIYWNGCDDSFVEETIISVLSPEERAAWAKSHAPNPAESPRA